MKKYQSYKPSGVEWIGVVPDEWRVSKFKYVSKLYTGNSLNDEQKILYESDDENDIPYVSSKDIDLNTRSVNYNNGIRIPKEKNNFKVSPKDSFLLCVEGGSSGRKMVYLEREVCFVNKLCSFKSVENTRFQYYFIQSSNFQDKFKFSLSGLIGGVSISTLRDFELLLPSLKEQQQIVQFLDEKTELIDKLISTKEQKITLLKEQRTSLINQGVTKGLNPNVKMKDSGVEWIGDIPEHWFCVGTNKVYQDLGTGTTPTSDNEDYYSEDGFHWITTTDLNEGIMYDTLTKISNKSIIDYPNLRLYPSGSIYISMYGGRIGKLGISTFDSYCNQSVCVLPKNDKINVKFYYYWFLGFQELVKNMGRGGGQPNINKEMIKQFPTVKIDLIEQNEIIEYLDSKTNDINNLVDLEQKKIDLLKEYRQSLISEVVTGKIKVTN